MYTVITLPYGYSSLRVPFHLLIRIGHVSRPSLPSSSLSSTRKNVSVTSSAMPPKRSLNTSSNKKKRSASPDGNTGDLPGGKTTKKHKADDDLLHQPHPSAALSEEHGIVLRKYYPAEMSNARARAYNEGTIRRPAEELAAALEETAEARALIGASGDATAASVVHWFRRDLRTADNRGLRLASEKARDLGNGGGDGGDGGGVPLVGLYVLCAADLEAHLEAPARVDFALRSLAVLRADLAARFDIPLHVEVVGEGCDVVPRVLALARDRWRAAWLFANMEYEVDELRRYARLVRLGAAAGAGGDGGEGGDGGGLAVEIVHDACVVPPGALATGAGRQYSVYTPWFRAWAAHLAAHPGLLAASEPPLRNPPGARTADGRFAALFASSSEIPEAPHGKRIADAAQAAHLRALWPAGEHAAVERLGAFCARSIAAYASARDFPARADATSSLSPHFAAGTLSARAAVRAARDQGATDTGKNTARLDAGPEGVRRWIGEVAWRDFYKHVLVNWPYVWFVIRASLSLIPSLPVGRKLKELTSLHAFARQHEQAVQARVLGHRVVV